MLLLVILVDAEGLAISVLVLEDVRVLLPLQPGVLQVEQHGLRDAPVQQVVHLLGRLQVSEVSERRGRAHQRVVEGCPPVDRHVLVAHLALFVGLEAGVFGEVLLLLGLRLTHFQLDFNIWLLRVLQLTHN